jgi:RNA polymerase sigma-70 factor (ECF subfamily)
MTALAERRSAPLAAALPCPVAWHEVLSHRSYLVRFAQRRLHDPMLAEDVVHDVFEAVLCGRAAFAGRSALRARLTAVLKPKIVGTNRQRARVDPLDAIDAGEDAAALAIESGEAGPEEIAEQRQRLERTLERIETLPDGLRDAIRLRVLDDQPTAAVCAALGISEENLFVRMHRARKHLAS